MNQFYRDYLDENVDRLGTNCLKWDYLDKIYGRSDLVSAWVADMDFRTVPEVKDALAKRVEHAIYGYTDNSEEEKQAEIGWLKRRHNIDVEPEWILYSPGVVDSIFFCVRALTNEDDSVLVQTPVYGPFYNAVRIFDRKLVMNPLIETESGWQMDFSDLEDKFSQGVKMMILCSPHNPIGRVWTQEELEKVIELANRYHVIIVSDEIHADFVFDGHHQTRIHSPPETDNCIMLTSATKSFNLAGLRQSSCIVRNPELRERISKELQRSHATSPNIFGAIAQTAAYTYGDEWMDAVVEYVCENRDYVVSFLKEKLPEIKVHPLEGTYLMWLDFRALGIEHDTLKDMLINDAHVALNSGLDYGREGEGHFRLNLASPHANIERVMENIYNMIRSR